MMLSGRLGVVFAHYNYFGDGAGHTGDTVFSFNITDRTDVKLVWAWGASYLFLTPFLCSEFIVLSQSLFQALSGLSRDL